MTAQTIITITGLLDSKIEELEPKALEAEKQYREEERKLLDDESLDDLEDTEIMKMVHESACYKNWKALAKELSYLKSARNEFLRHKFNSAF